MAVIAGEPVELANGRMASRSMDNRLGCFVAREALRLLAAEGCPLRGEEVDLAAARWDGGQAAADGPAGDGSAGAPVGAG